MTDIYASQQVGVADGTVPASRSDGRQVHARKRSILASKVTGTAWTTADKVYLGKKPAGEIITDIKVTTDTSFGTSTLSIGTLTSASKYVAAKTQTATDVPTSIGPKASTLDDGPGDEEDLWLTIGTATIASGTVATFEIVTSGA